MRADASIAVIRALRGLGDMLCAVPALSALRLAHPRAHITLIGLPACDWLLRRFGTVVDALTPFPGFPGIPEERYSPNALASFLRRVQSDPFDLAIQMHGCGTTSNAFTALLGAKSIAGLYRPGQYRPEGGRFFPYPEHGSEVHRWLYLTAALECPGAGDRLAFPIAEADRVELRRHALLHDLGAGSFVCLHPGARDPARRWPAARFARVADDLAGRGYPIVLTGTAAERPAAEEVAAAMRSAAIDAAGRTSLGVAAALLERAALLVTNDTGMSHLAAALGVPSVVVFLASSPERWAPLDRARHRPVLARELTSHPPEGMRRSRRSVPDADEVLAEALGLLNRGGNDGG